MKTALSHHSLAPAAFPLALLAPAAAAAPAVVPLTLPSHATMLTGLYPIAHGVSNNGSYRLSAGFPTLAESLRAAGYDTAAFVAA